MNLFVHAMCAPSMCICVIILGTGLNRKESRLKYFIGGLSVVRLFLISINSLNKFMFHVHLYKFIPFVLFVYFRILFAVPYHCFHLWNIIGGACFVHDGPPSAHCVYTLVYICIQLDIFIYIYILLYTFYTHLYFLYIHLKTLYIHLFASFKAYFWFKSYSKLMKTSLKHTSSSKVCFLFNPYSKRMKVLSEVSLLF